MEYRQHAEIFSGQKDYFKRLTSTTEKVKSIALQCLIPIIDCSDKYNIHVIGSSVLLSFNNRTYLVTASHVIPETDSKTYFLPCADRLMALGGHTMRMRSTDEADRHDLLAFAPYPELVTGLSNFTPLQIRSTDIQKMINPDENVAIFGYPKSRNRKHRQKIPKFYIQGLTERTAFLDVYGKEGYSPDTNILIQFNREKCYTPALEPITHPDPDGMSGGGVWRLFGPSDRYNPIEPYLIGIVIEKSRTERYIVVVKLGYIVTILSRLEEHVNNGSPPPSPLPPRP